MVLAVHKQTLVWPADEQRVQFPEGAELLTVQRQGAALCIWARVNLDMPLTDYVIRTCGTGHPLDDNAGAYLGSFQLLGGDLVFHSFGRAAA